MTENNDIEQRKANNCHWLWHCWTLLSLWGVVENTVVTYIKERRQSVIFFNFKIDQIINDHEWTTNNALLFSDEILVASKPCNHNRLLYVVILC
jgi:hypothetical protein